MAPDLEKAIAGSRLLVVGPDDDEDDLRDEVMSDLTTLLNSIDKSGRGVCVQASTLGSLEALLDFLKVSKIPVSGINIGPVHKKDVMRAATMLEKARELACILCFDVTVDRDAEKLAEEMGIRLFKGSSDITRAISVHASRLTHFTQPTSYTTYSTPLLRTTLKLWKRRGETLLQSLYGLVDSRSLRASVSGILSYWVWTFSTVPCVWARHCVS